MLAEGRAETRSRRTYLLSVCFVFLLLSFLSELKYQPAYAAPPFDRIPTDKWAHFFASAYLTEYGQNRGTPDGTLAIQVSALGLGKEIYDSWMMKEPWDWGDLWADGLGIGLALLVN